MTTTHALEPGEQRILDLLPEHGGYVRTADILQAGIDHHALTRLTERGLLERVRRGLYRRSDLISSDIGVLDVAATVPEGVICLLSALSHYELTTTTPWEVYVGIRRKAWRPRIDYPPVRFVFYTDRMYAYGICEEALSTGQPVRMYSPEKSIADAFHFDGIVEREIALEALKTYMGRRRARHIHELLKAAEVCRVLPTVRRYVEALV